MLWRTSFPDYLVDAYKNLLDIRSRVDAEIADFAQKAALRYREYPLLSQFKDDTSWQGSWDESLSTMKERMSHSSPAFGDGLARIIASAFQRKGIHQHPQIRAAADELQNQIDRYVQEALKEIHLEVRAYSKHDPSLQRIWDRMWQDGRTPDDPVGIPHWKKSCREAHPELYPASRELDPKPGEIIQRPSQQPESPSEARQEGPSPWLFQRSEAPMYVQECLRRLYGPKAELGF